ncbi:MarR family transcriptional regulator [Bacillus licheniformis]|nr:MarR family transcriptional regulator [Bacillus licheniformis]
MIDRLEKAGYVRRIRDSSDRRRLLVELIPEIWRRYHIYFMTWRKSLPNF